jgi:(1->4)-alpha-D-glucan 1-alpha-D-glucosylmutase
MLRARFDDLAKRPLHERSTESAYIVVEKILGKGEILPTDWDVDGTTGYDFMNDISALQHCAQCAIPLGEFWHTLSGRSGQFEDEEITARPEILDNAFASALHQATRYFFALAHDGNGAHDITEHALRRGLSRIFEHLRVYRTYATGADDSADPGEFFSHALAAAKRNCTPLDAAAIDFIARVMHGKDGNRSTIEAVRRFNQLAAPVAAKAVEDTAFYRYGRLLSRNDVGFHPGNLAIDSADFHRRMSARVTSFPHALLATATHDHKRGEDARARLAVLSEIPRAWEEAVQSWLPMNATHRTQRLTLGDEYQLYQTLIGAWPLDLDVQDAALLDDFGDRILAWRLKSLREQKLSTSWLDPDSEFEEANSAFVHAILDSKGSSEFLNSLQDFVNEIAPAGALNGLVQTALRCTVPGVPDCYQGAEFWDFSLVDPDNRRAVDYAARNRTLDPGRTPQELLGTWRDGRVKQYVIAKLLHLREQEPRLFKSGTYTPLHLEGERDKRVLAFVREFENEILCVAVPLHCAEACDARPVPNSEFWQDTTLTLPARLAGQAWSHLFDDKFACRGIAAVSCADLFAKFPIAVLTPA